MQPLRGRASPLLRRYDPCNAKALYDLCRDASSICQDKYHKPSRFIKELPTDCVQEVRMKAQVSRSMSSGRFSQAVKKENFNETGYT